MDLILEIVSLDYVNLLGYFLFYFSMAYGTRWFNAAFTRARQQFLFWAESTQFPALTPISSRSILILSSHLRLGLPKGLFPVGLPVKLLLFIIIIIAIVITIINVIIINGY